MTEAIICALITGGLALLGTIVTGRMTVSKVMHQLDTAQAVTDTKVEELTREVRAHNNFAQRVPVMEEQIGTIREQIEELKAYHKGGIT